METKENTRVCYKCNVEKRLSSKNFHKSKLIKSGYSRLCSQCKSDYDSNRPSRGKLAELEAENKKLKEHLKQNDFLSKMMKT